MEDISWLMYLMMVLASYRFTHLIVFDKITDFLRKPFLRKIKKHNLKGECITKKKPTSMFGYLVNCYWCAGIWSAIVIGSSYIFFPTFAIPFIFVLSIAGAQAIIETFVGVAEKQTKHLSNENDLVIEPEEDGFD
jgi:hypothetical protein